MSSHRQFAGRQWVGRQFLPSLFTGVGSSPTFTPMMPEQLGMQQMASLLGGLYALWLTLLTEVVRHV